MFLRSLYFICDEKGTENFLVVTTHVRSLIDVRTSSTGRVKLKTIVVFLYKYSFPFYECPPASCFIHLCTFYIKMYVTVIRKNFIYCKYLKLVIFCLSRLHLHEQLFILITNGCLLSYLLLFGTTLKSTRNFFYTLISGQNEMSIIFHVYFLVLCIL